MKFSLIIPCYNEARNLPLLIDRCKSVNQNHDIEVIFVDNGSTDDTSSILKDSIDSHHNLHSVRVEINQGYGFGILAGLDVASGDVLGWTHADMQADPLDVIDGLNFFAKNPNAFVKGKRFGRPLIDVIFTIGMSIFESILLNRPMWDINAQPCMFSRTFYETWETPPYDFSLDLYAYFMAKKQGLKTYRFKVKFGERAFGISHWNVDWKAKVKFIKRTVEYSLKLKREL